MRSVRFSFHTSISDLPVFCLLFSQISIVIHPKSLVFFSVNSALQTYVIYYRERIPDISILFVMSYQCDNTRSFAHVFVYVRRACSSSSRSRRESAFQFYYPPRYDLDNEILRGVFRPPSELHSTIIEIRMKRIPRARYSRAGPVDDRGTWAKPPGAEGVGDFFVTNFYGFFGEALILSLKSMR